MSTISDQIAEDAAQRLVIIEKAMTTVVEPTVSLPGRRVEKIADLGKPCDYAVMRRDGEITALWFILPNGVHGRISAEGHAQRGEPTWGIIVHDDETVTVHPSILCEVKRKGPSDGEPPATWHGWLTNGRWSPA